VGWIEAAYEFHNNVRVPGQHIGEVLGPLNGIWHPRGRLGSTLRLKTQLSRKSGRGARQRISATARPTVPKPKRATLGGKGIRHAVCEWAAALRGRAPSPGGRLAP
jgi:hypothetical protein